MPGLNMTVKIKKFPGSNVNEHNITVNVFVASASAFYFSGFVILFHFLVKTPILQKITFFENILK
jgi:hypothetical protein